MAKICIIAVTYDRPLSFKRLFASLCRADYCGQEVDFLVSVDGGQRSEGTLEAIGDIDWPHGDVKIRRMSENLGLRRHILHCGQTTESYEAIILLEDDIVVGERFYAFSDWAIGQYHHDTNVAGISLYAPSYNEMANLPFDPQASSQDVYALQSAQSWGQCWTRAMWVGFEKWYVAHGGVLQSAHDMPERIYSWPDSSWKKFAMKYLAETGKTWIYPYQSHSTNCSAIGTHNQLETALFQVPLNNAVRQFIGAPLEQLVQYDIHFERTDLPKPAYIDASQDLPLVCDLYATRQSIKGPVFLLTTRMLKREAVCTFGLAFKPHEVNMSMETLGSAARLYLVNAGETIDLRQSAIERSIDFYAGLQWTDQLRAGSQGLLHAVARRLKRLI